MLVAGSCAPVSQGGHGTSSLPYDTAEVERTIAFGYNAIVERNLTRVDASAVALDGMGGLAGIDPAVAVTQLDGRILLNTDGRMVAEYPAPARNDVKGWARLTVTVALDARAASPALHDADPERIYEAVFDSVLSHLDVFSRYAGAKEAREHRASRNGFGGVGIKFDLAENQPVVTEVMPDSPAARAGMQKGDYITRIDGESMTGLDRDEISRHLRGPISSAISISLRRGFKPIEVSLYRALIVPPTVTANLVDGIAEFRVSSFNQNTASSLRHELEELAARHHGPLKGVVLDLRGNPGGLLDQGVALADLFIKDGPILSTRGRHPLASQYYDAREGDVGESLPVVVVVDGKSASAAEIVAAALQDSGRAVVVGTNSYGKGTVQTVIRLPNDGEITLTWSRFHSPAGYALHGLGVLPTLCTAGDGVSTTGVLNALEQSPMGSQAPITTNLTLWRHAALDDTDLRTKLRATCPAAAHPDSRMEMEVAERLLGDRIRYFQALALSSPTPLGEQSADVNVRLPRLESSP